MASFSHADKFSSEDEYETYLVDIQAVTDVPDAQVCESVTAYRQLQASKTKQNTIPASPNPYLKNPAAINGDVG